MEWLEPMPLWATLVLGYGVGAVVKDVITFVVLAVKNA
jgi:hypothetical protein